MRKRIESLAPTVAPMMGAVLLCASLVQAVPASATQAKSRLQPQVTTETMGAGFRVKTHELAIQPLNLDVSRFAFTAPGRVATTRVQTVERAFTFTPSRSSKGGVSVGMTARSVGPNATADRTAATDSALMPAGYNFDLSLGYKGFAVSGGMSRLDTGFGGRSSEGIDVGLGYDARNWRAGVTASAERETGYIAPLVGTPDPRYSVEARGALALSPQVSVAGSLRYRVAPENPTPLDPNKDDRAVMLGGAVAF